MRKDRDKRKTKNTDTEEVTKIRKTEMYCPKQITVTFSN